MLGFKYLLLYVNGTARMNVKKETKIQDQETKIQDQETKIQDQETKIQDQETKINAILQRLEKAGIAE